MQLWSLKNLVMLCFWPKVAYTRIFIVSKKDFNVGWMFHAVYTRICCWSLESSFQLRLATRCLWWSGHPVLRGSCVTFLFQEGVTSTAVFLADVFYLGIDPMPEMWNYYEDKDGYWSSLDWGIRIHYLWVTWWGMIIWGKWCSIWKGELKKWMFIHNHKKSSFSFCRWGSHDTEKTSSVSSYKLRDKYHIISLH